MLRRSVQVLVTRQQGVVGRLHNSGSEKRWLGLVVTSNYQKQSFFNTKRFFSSKIDEKEEETKEVALTTAEKVKVGMNLSGIAAMLGLAGVCSYFILTELFPNKLSPNSIFDRALEEVRRDERVSRLVGEPIKGYGRDHGGHREGRRNFIENTHYKAPDGAKRVRVRFNISGPYSQAFVYAEVAQNFKEFVYLMVQDRRSGKVVVLVDNRATFASDSNLRSDSERSALADLLRGPTSSSR